LDDQAELGSFAKKLEMATLAAVEAGEMTGDLACIANPAPGRSLNSWEFIDAIAGRMGSRESGRETK